VKRLGLLVLVLAASLSSCTLPSLLSGGAAVLPPDPLGATFTAVQVPGQTYTALTYLPGKTGTLNTVAHLVGPALRVNDSRCAPEPKGLLCVLGTVPALERRVIYVTGYASSKVEASREDGTPVKISGK